MSFCKTLCINKKPKKYNKLFFGDYGNFQRIDKVNYEIFKKLTKNSEANTWFVDEIDFSKDKKGWQDLPDTAKRMFHLNVLYQNILDSLVPNTFFALAELATDTWLSILYTRIAMEENAIHAPSYSEGLNSMFGAEATEMLDYVYQDDMLKKRADEEIKIANEFLDYVYKQENTDDKAKKLLLELLIRTYFLEGIKFPFSFFVTWIINKNYNNNLQGFSQLLKLIAWDEMTIHTTTGQQVMNILMTDKSQEFSHLKNWFENKVVEVVKEVVDLEIDWAKYLLKEGGIDGFNLQIAEHFIKYWADFRLKALNINPVYNEKKSDIIVWYNDYRNLNKTMVNLQEADNTNYQKGTLKNDLFLLKVLN